MDRAYYPGGISTAVWGGKPFLLILLQLVLIMVVYGMFVLGTCIAIWPMMYEYPVFSPEKRKVWLLVGLILVFISFTWNIANTTNVIGRPGGLSLKCTVPLACSNVVDAEFSAGPFEGILEAIPVTITNDQAEVSFNPTNLSGIINLIVNYSGVLDLVSISISFLVNVVATISIGWKAWAHHKSMKEAAIYKRTHGLRILLLLAESGAIFCAVQLLCTVLFPTTQGRSWKGFDRSVDMKFPLSGPDVNAQPEKNYASDIMIFATAFYPVTVAILIRRAPSPEMGVETTDLEYLL
ncbi:hypothetical protein BDP27DRAFT_1506077 [Rhodocollybia butyracea]|uniref:Uncharacterized protein n=1 Tax=Rhodocollybia butyracea TaxID=206335 RepID=A0A9P5P4G2_9AGAR|nr:hypothetical protein BDP27DRAFT_1506077 [Rhodocollybia butyracea]